MRRGEEEGGEEVETGSQGIESRGGQGERQVELLHELEALDTVKRPNQSKYMLGSCGPCRKRNISKLQGLCLQRKNLFSQALSKG